MTVMMRVRLIDMEELVTCDAILLWLKQQAEKKIPVDPMLYIQAAEKLNALKSDETDKLIDLQYVIATEKSSLLANDMTSAAAKVHVEAMDVYKDMRRQEMKCRQIDESIRLAKLHGRLLNEQMRSNL